MRNILITGANRGFGLALAKQASQQGYQLYLVVRSEKAKQQLNKVLTGTQVLVCDITRADYQAKLSQWLGDATLDVVINNAGSGTRAPSLESTEPEFLRKELETNCIAVLATVKGALTALQRSSRGLVINVSSRRGSLSMQASLAAKGSGCSYSYRISKAAQNMLTLCLADDLDEFGIGLVALHPGRMLTNMAAKDAHLTAEQSAQKLLTLIAKNQLKSREFVCLESGTLPW